MSLTAAERETCMVMTDEDKKWKVYTCNRWTITRLEKQGFEPESVKIDEDGNEYRTYMLERNEVKFRKTKEYTDEEKQIMRERFLKSINKNKK